MSWRRTALLVTAAAEALLVGAARVQTQRFAGVACSEASHAAVRQRSSTNESCSRARHFIDHACKQDSAGWLHRAPWIMLIGAK